MSRIVVAATKRALYFGYGRGGHFLRGGPRDTIDPPRDIPGFPWEIGLLDTGLLRNREVPDAPDGRVHWTCGGIPLWLAFFWWDRSGDTRGASNSGFYVQGFSHLQAQEAFDYACSVWPDVVARQLYPLVLVGLDGKAVTDDEQTDECLRQGLEWHDELIALRAANAALRNILEQLQEPLWTRDIDVEHTIECHADSLPEAYRRLNAQLEQALALVAKALGSDKLG